MSEKLTAAAIGQHFREGHAIAVAKLNEWELAKAALLVRVGRESLALIRETLEPLPDADLAARKAARAEMVKAIEAELPGDCEGIGVPQLNRWMRWAGALELLAPEALYAEMVVAGGLKQSHLMVLETFVQQHEPTGLFSTKPSWAKSIDKMRDVLKRAGTMSAKELEAALDETAEVEAPVTPPKEAECQTTSSTTSSKSTAVSRNASEASNPASTSSKSESEASSAAPGTKATGSGDSKPASTCSKPTPNSSSKPSSTAPCASSSNAPAPTTKDSAASASKNSPTSQKNDSSASSSAAGPCPADLAEQAYRLLQNPEILAGVFRREWKPDLLREIGANLITACGENSQNPLGLCKLYHRIKPFVLTYFEEYAEGGKFKLLHKAEPEAPTLEQLAPCGELQEA
ncbi:MAG: hypothetical protein K2P78_04555 [Gemmataceae bacterium]|nr:hypothetical protein [Gemmataceae bacterium]